MAKGCAERIPNKPGVYAILCEANHKVYIGKGDLYPRKASHWSSLKGNNHFNKELQKDWHKYGERSFRFVILYETQYDEDVQYLDQCEQYWIGMTMATNKKYGYNNYKKPSFTNSYVVRIESI
ncbi:GIY-YIG nuclease family protein [Brevibacillus nitrificans]|uniref:GIY-YIG nuclease family protein n=1 Tax=Brevibacillus nitrificans TaxID=651560 RepID=UPI002860C8F2|nr:hypothetical protein [Brevibacillus nitrificans]